MTNDPYDVVKMNIDSRNIVLSMRTERILRLNCNTINELICKDDAKGYLVDYNDDNKLVTVDVFTDSISLKGNSDFWEMCKTLKTIRFEALRPYEENDPMFKVEITFEL